MSLVSSFIENPKNYIPLTTESNSKPDADIYIRTCKVCGKKFSCTNPKEWVYRVVVTKGSKSIPVCSYGCELEHERENKKPKRKYETAIDLNERVRDLRKNMDLTQEQMAKLIGISPVSVSKVEAYNAPVSNYILEKYIAYFGREEVLDNGISESNGN